MSMAKELKLKAVSVRVPSNVYAVLKKIAKIETKENATGLKITVSDLVRNMMIKRAVDFIDEGEK